MRYLKTFEQLITTNNRYTLYHGSPFEFDKFKDQITYFSETEEFALKYANSKADTVEIDQIHLYKCILEANIFDITNLKHLSILKSQLPEEVEVTMPQTFFNGNISKDDILYHLQGKSLVKPNNEIISKVKEIYQTFSYDGDHLICIDISENDVKYLRFMDYESFYKCAVNGKKNFERTGKYYNLPSFQIFRERAIEYLNKQSNFNEDVSLINYIAYLPDEILQILKEAKEDLRIQLIKDNEYKSLNKNTYVADIKDSWIYYENSVVEGIIERNGFDGYVATERNQKTYAIFHPNKCIINIKKTY